MKKNELIKHIELIWENLKDEGVSTMMKMDESKAPIYLRANDQTVSFLLAVSMERELDIKQKKYYNVNIAVEKLSSETKGIVVTLLNQRFLDTFSKIAADVISATMPMEAESEAVSIFTLKSIVGATSLAVDLCRHSAPRNKWAYTVNWSSLRPS